MRPKRRGFECVGGDLEVWAVKFVAVVAWSDGGWMEVAFYTAMGLLVCERDVG